MNREPETRPGACDDEDLRMAVGALALGALDADEAREVRRHLADCPECQQEYASFVGVKRVMDIGLVGAPMPETVPPEAAGQPGHSRRRRLFGTRTPAPFRAPRRQRIMVAAGGSAAALVLVVGGFWAGHGGTSSGSTNAEMLPAVTQSGVTAQISYQDHSWGTSVTAKMSGTPDGLTCTLYVYDKNHDVIQLSNWKSVAGKAIDIPAATALPAEQIDHFEVRVVGYGAYDITVPMSS
ncbi:hypothetical protein ABIA31_000979 [Catenulispora sp. MAP5-51]|uniref:zf-HC2 domain-containing protein n=1 Tax=Catenulispora sp. MAP5-51 TaxID=3156298 RepID=UPI003510D465